MAISNDDFPFLFALSPLYPYIQLLKIPVLKAAPPVVRDARAARCLLQQEARRPIRGALNDDRFPECRQPLARPCVEE